MSKIHDYISQLPEINAVEESLQISIDGFLIRSLSNDTIRIGLENFVLEIELDDVLDVVERGLSAGQRKRIAIPVTVTLKVGFRVRNLVPDEPFRALYYEPMRSFASQTRELFSLDPPVTAFKQRERAFLRKRGVTWLRDS